MAWCGVILLRRGWRPDATRGMRALAKASEGQIAAWGLPAVGMAVAITQLVQR